MFVPVMCETDFYLVELRNSEEDTVIFPLFNLADMRFLFTEVMYAQFHQIHNNPRTDCTFV